MLARCRLKRQESQRGVFMRIGVCSLCLVVMLAKTSLGNETSEPLEHAIQQFERAYERWDIAGLTEAASSLEEASEVASASADAWYWLGVARFHVLLNRRNAPDQMLTKKEIERLAAPVDEALEKALEINPAAAECYAIRGTVLGIEIAEGVRSPFLHGRTLRKYERLARNYGGENPRVQYLLGVNRIRTAKGSKALKEGLKTLLDAEALFEKEGLEQRSTLQPSWGYDHCLIFMGETYRELGETQDAKACFRKALEVNPSSRRAKRELDRMQ